MLAEILLLILEIGWHYHNSGPEQLIVKFFWLAPTYLSIFPGPIINISRVEDVIVYCIVIM